MSPAASVHAQEPVADHAPEPTFGRYLHEITGLADPQAVAVGQDGRIYVADTGHHCVRVFDAAGRQLAQWASFGSCPGELQSPAGIALDAANRVYVADTANERIVVFDATGSYLRDWGEHGAEPGQFVQPRGITCHRDQVYVADSGNGRVQVFGDRGGFRSALWCRGAAGGPPSRPVDVAVDDHRDIYVADEIGDLIYKFNQHGHQMQSWGGRGVFPGLLAGPTSVDHAAGVIYVADSKNQRIEAFDLNGQTLGQWGAHALAPREGAGKFHYPSAVAVAPAGDFAVVCEALEDRCQVFGRSDQPDRSLPPVTALGGITHFARRADTAGDLLISTEPDTNVVQVFKLHDDEAIVVTQFGEHGQQLGRFLEPADVMLDPVGWLVNVCDRGSGAIQTFRLAYDPSARLRFDPYMSRVVKSWNLVLAAEPAGGIAEPLAMVRDHRGNTCVLDARSDRILVFDRKLAYKHQLGGYGRFTGEFRGPTDMAFNRDGDVLYVVDAGNYRVQAFDPQGRDLFQWGRRGSGEGEFDRPFGICAGKDGFVYLTDSGSNRVQKFDEQGRFVAQWGRAGIGPGEFHKPAGIVQTDLLRIIVIDFGNHRCQIFTPDGRFVHAFGSREYILPANRSAAAEN